MDYYTWRSHPDAFESSPADVARWDATALAAVHVINAHFDVPGGLAYEWLDQILVVAKTAAVMTLEFVDGRADPLGTGRRFLEERAGDDERAFAQAIEVANILIGEEALVPNDEE